MASITVYADVILPDAIIAAGVRGRQIRRNTRTPSPNGRMQINVDSDITQRRFELGVVPLLVAQWAAIEGLHEVTDGGAYGFLMRDPKNNKVDVGAGLLYPYTTELVGAIGLGYGVPTYRLFSRYTSIGSTRTKDRRISRPLAGAPIVRAGSPVTYGASAGNAALDTTTGAVTFVADTSQACSSITVGASTVLNFSSGTPVVAAFSIGQRVYLSGITGTAGAALNGLSHAITAKGASSLTISTATTGLAVTLPGTAYKYPQASEALIWSGPFYVPVHFESDEIDWELLRGGNFDRRLVAGPSVVLLEVIE
jgi:hypothetical protein